MNSIQENIATYEEMRNLLESDHFGKWVLIHDRAFVESYDTFEYAAQDAVRRFGRGPYLIRRAGVPEAPLPASVMYRELV